MMMNTIDTNKDGYEPVYIPIDLIPEILSRLPAKSVGRFRCVSKKWESILNRQDFTELFFTRSSARPRLLLVLQRNNDELLILSAPQPQNPYEKSLVVTADYHMKLRGKMCGHKMCSYASGLVYVPDVLIPEDRERAAGVICNPITGQCVSLPVHVSFRKSTSFFGFEPIDKQLKVVAEAYPSFGDERDNHKILTLGTGKLRWRGNNHCPPYYRFTCQGICIDGVLYYLADNYDTESDLIVSFDMKSEQFKFIRAECFRNLSSTRLINYKGKLGGINLKYNDDNAVVLSMWVLEDVEKEEWLKYVYTLPKHEASIYNVFVVGMTARDEIVLAEKVTSNPYHVFFFNPDGNTLQSVEIQGVGPNGEDFETDCIVYAFVDHVEDISDRTQVKHYIVEDEDEDKNENEDEYGNGDGDGFPYYYGYGFPYDYGYGFPYYGYGFPYYGYGLPYYGYGLPYYGYPYYGYGYPYDPYYG